MSSDVNMLTNSLKILDTTKTEFLELIFFQRDQKISKKYCRADLNSLSDLLKYFLNFFLHFQTLKKIRNTLKKKNEPWRLFVSEIIHCKKRSYLNAQKAPCQNTYWQSTLQTLEKPARQYFCPNFWWLSKKMSSKNSVLVVSIILRLIVNILTPDDKYSLPVKGSF